MAHLGPLVLETNSLKIPALTADRDQPVLRRFEPSSRSALMGEQTNPWNLLQLQDALSRPKIHKCICALQLLLVVWTISFVLELFYFTRSFTYWRFISYFKNRVSHLKPKRFFESVSTGSILSNFLPHLAICKLK